jgi:hypothetical protein
MNADPDRDGPAITIIRQRRDDDNDGPTLTLLIVACVICFAVGVVVGRLF